MRVRELKARNDPQVKLLEATPGLMPQLERSFDRMSDEQLEQTLAMESEARRKGGSSTTPFDAVNSYILPGVMADEWRILVGPDAAEIDKAVRADPVHAYDAGFAGFGIGEGSWYSRQQKSKM